MAGKINPRAVGCCLWLPGLLWGLLGPVAAQQRPVHFEFGHLREQDGLSFRATHCLLTDRDGFLWVGTGTGLNRYDGTHFVQFRHQRNNPTSLPNNTVYALCEDRQGHIWGGFENGVSRYDKATGKFWPITTVNNQPLGICKNVCCDRAGNIWFTSRNRGLFRYATKTGAIQYFPGYPADSTGGIRTLPNGLLEDPYRNGFWMAERSGLCYFDTDRQQWSSSRYNPLNLPIFTPNFTSALALDGDRLLISDNTDNCIIVYDLRRQRILKRIRPPEPADRSEFEVAALFVDRHHNLWVGTWGNKSFFIDAQTDRFTELGHDKVNSNALGSDLIRAGGQHPDGTIWLGTVNGIAYTNPERALYDVYNLENLFPALSDERGIVTFTEDPDGSWWLGTSIRGLLHYVPGTNQLTVYRLPNRTARYTWGYPVTGLDGHGDELFVGSDSWVYRFNKQTGQFREVPLPPEATSVYLRTFRLQGNRYWAFGDGKLAFAYDLTQERWQTYPIRSASPDPNFLVRQSLLDRRGRLWLDIYPEGFARFDPQQDCFVVTDTRQTDYESFIYSLAEDPNGQFLMATTLHGLVQYDPLHQRDSVRAENELMPLGQVTDALPDRFGNSWVAGLNLFSVITHRGKQVLNFRLPINEHTIEYNTHLFPLRNGHILSVQKGYVVEIKPENLRLPPIRETVLLNRVVLPDSALLLYGTTTNIPLKAEDNSFTIEFSVLSTTTKHRYLAKLAGYDDDWQEANPQTGAVYNRLPGGDYVFTVKAITPEGVETPTRTLTIHMATRFYQATWFWGLVLLVMLGLLVGFFRYRARQVAQIYRLQMQATRLERDKTRIQYQNLINHLNPHFLFNSLTSLNSLISIEPKKASAFLKKLSVIYRYILQNKDNELVSLQSELVFAQHYIDLQIGRFGEGLQVDVRVDPALLMHQIVPVTIQNLLENAIKHNTVDDETPLHIEIYTAGDTLIVMNTLHRKDFVDTSNKQGLASLRSLYGYLSGRPIIITETDTHFSVTVPLL